MKPDRQKKMLDLIKKYEIETQEELAQRLQEAGYGAAQSTISRDIRELNLRKEVGSQGKLVYVSPQEDSQNTDNRYPGILRDAFVSADASGNILVIRTASGMAMAVAAVLDGLKWEELLGCIAGDDTIFCVVKKEEHSQIILDRLHVILKAI